MLLCLLHWILQTTELFLHQDEEFYVCIHSSRDVDTVLFHHEGGVDVGNVDEKANKTEVSLKKQHSSSLVVMEFPFVDCFTSCNADNFNSALLILRLKGSRLRMHISVHLVLSIFFSLYITVAAPARYFELWEAKFSSQA